MKKYDVLVIGSGGGTKISTPAASLGLKAAIIEKAKWGGTCLNRGCIPSKMLIHPANIAHQVKESSKYGLKTKYNGVNFEKLTSRITREVSKDSRSIPKWYDTKKNLDYYEGTAKFISDKVVEVNGKIITAKKIFIAVGGRPFIPPIPGLHGTPFMTSTEALRSKILPKKLLVIGGGYIAAELGHAYGALGSDVHILVRNQALLTREDSEVSKEFTKSFSKQYNVHFNVNTEKVSYKNGKFTLTLKTKYGRKTLSGDGLLVATGVKPNTDTLSLGNTSVKTNERGFVRVNKFMETSVKDVYALGDCVGNYMFRHSVNFEGEFLFNNLIKKKKKVPIKYPPMPHAVFSSPEIAAVGLTEEEAKKRKINYVVGLHQYKDSAQGMARLSKVGFVKLLFHKKTRKLLGAHIVGDEASIMIHQLIYAIHFNATLDNLLEMIYIHPALPEVVRNACRDAKKLF